MSRSRWALSLFFVCHLTAIALGALPSPDRLPKIDPPRHPTDDPIAARLTPVLDGAVGLFSRVPAALWNVTAPVRSVTDLYLATMRLEQTWSMFWSPPKIDKYLRVRYYVGRREPQDHSVDSAWTATELVLPVDREDRFRQFQSYGNQSRNNAIATAVDNFYRHRGPRKPGSSPAELPDDLVPLLRYFTRRFADEHLLPDERIVRTELWYGFTPNPPRGEPGPLDARLTVLRRYYDGPIESRVGRSSYPPYGAVEQEADIVWVLDYFGSS